MSQLLEPESLCYGIQEPLWIGPESLTYRSYNTKYIHSIQVNNYTVVYSQVLDFESNLTLSTLNKFPPHPESVVLESSVKPSLAC